MLVVVDVCLLCLPGTKVEGCFLLVFVIRFLCTFLVSLSWCFKRGAMFRDEIDTMGYSFMKG